MLPEAEAEVSGGHQQDFIAFCLRTSTKEHTSEHTDTVKSFRRPSHPMDFLYLYIFLNLYASFLSSVPSNLTFFLSFLIHFPFSPFPSACLPTLLYIVFSSFFSFLIYSFLSSILFLLCLPLLTSEYFSAFSIGAVLYLVQRAIIKTNKIFLGGHLSGHVCLLRVI